jgi:hypothetical protein
VDVSAEHREARTVTVTAVHCENASACIPLQHSFTFSHV